MTFSSLLRRLGALALLGAVPATLSLLPAQPAMAQGDDVAAVARAIRAITTLKATFQQVDPNGQIQNGSLLLQQPGRVRFEYKGGDMLIVADGKSLTFIDYQVAQVQRYPIRNSPLGPLLDPNRDLTRYGKIVPTGDPRFVSVDVRDPSHPEYGTMTIVFAKKDSAPAGLELTGWIARDAQGNRTTIRLGNIVHGAAIPKNAFSWRDPRPNMTGPR